MPKFRNLAIVEAISIAELENLAYDVHGNMGYGNGKYLYVALFS